LVDEGLKVFLVFEGWSVLVNVFLFQERDLTTAAQVASLGHKAKHLKSKKKYLSLSASLNWQKIKLSSQISTLIKDKINDGKITWLSWGDSKGFCQPMFTSKKVKLFKVIYFIKFNICWLNTSV
jgi:hypothetical protein